MVAIDIDKPTLFESEGTAFYRIPKDFRQFLYKCLETHEIVGFAWEGMNEDDNGWNFGVILGKKENGV